MTHDIITTYGLGREMAGSQQASDILNEYGKSKLRVWLEYGRSMGRAWLEHLFFRHERNLFPSRTNSFSVEYGLRALRYAALVVLMMVVGVSEMWGATVTYHIINMGRLDNSGQLTSTLLQLHTRGASTLLLWFVCIYWFSYLKSNI